MGEPFLYNVRILNPRGVLHKKVFVRAKNQIGALGSMPHLLSIVSLQNQPTHIYCRSAMVVLDTPFLH